ncbi:MAG TPA: alkaline phosphatase family protein [Candidatus Janibacter merdipullorum]|nr:alkaline phosphatase family protein [Candidatus Janibacter merdipullorum]
MTDATRTSTATTSRRTLLRFAAAGGATVAISGATGAPWAGAAPRKAQRVYVLVTDGLRPDEISADCTPTLHALRDKGTWYPNARSLPLMETLPNHVMMMTGVRPDRSGVPANKIYDPAAGEVRDMDRPSDITVPTIIERANDAGLTTGTVLSKDYLYGIFGDRATYRWEPKPLMPITDHAPDGYTYDALVKMVDEADPNLVFVNFGDIDRVGHSDLGGTINLPAMRYAALANTDRLIGDFVDHLKAKGTWEQSTIILLADHSMDWSFGHRVISLGAPIWFDRLLRDKVEIAQNGGADCLYWTGPASEKAAGLARLREVVLEQRGVLSVHTPEELRLGDRAGDLVAYCKAGWRFSDPTIFNNPIPGNHGHPVTAPIPFVIAGGSARLRPGARTAVAHTTDVAPTVGALLGLPSLPGGYDGRSRL